jgi:protein-S-isoprenylcysteine O-methyltransferase Ste14
MQTDLAAERSNVIGWSAGRSAIALDLAERAFVLGLGLFLIYRFAPTIGEQPLGLLLVISEVLMTVLVVIRRFGPQVNTGRAWAVAILGTCAPLMVAPVGIALLPVSVAFFLMMFGCLFSIGAKLFLRRSFGIVAANRGVQSTGPYRLVRHPMYLGYLLTHIGFLFTSLSGWNVLIYAICWGAMILRIQAEERILGEDPAYQAYSAGVRYRLVPFVW